MNPGPKGEGMYGEGAMVSGGGVVGRWPVKCRIGIRRGYGDGYGMVKVEVEDL